MIDDDLPAKRHGPLCGTNTEGSHTREDECEQLCFTAEDHDTVPHTHTTSHQNKQKHRNGFYDSEPRLTICQESGGCTATVTYMW